MIALQKVREEGHFLRCVSAAQQLEEQKGFATALLQNSQDELIARVNKTHVVGDPSDDELDDAKPLRARAKGWWQEGRCHHHHTHNFRIFLALWSISSSHVAMTKQEIVCVGRRCRLSEVLSLNQGGRQT